MPAGIISVTRNPAMTKNSLGSLTPSSSPAMTTNSSDPMAPAQALHAAEQRQAALAPAPGQTAMTNARSEPMRPPASLSGPRVSGYDASTRSVNDATDTVEGRIGGIISKNNPLIQMSQTRAKQEANSRGILNSTMAVQAGEMAAYGAALPIAQQDAANSNDVANRNMDATNTSRQFNAGAMNTGSLAKFGAEAELGRIGATGEQQRLTQAQSGQQALEQIGAQGTQQRLTQAQSGQQALEQIGAQGTQQRLTQQQANEAASKLQSERGQIDLMLQTADASTKERLLARQGDIDKQLQELRGQQAITQQTIQGRQSLEQIGAQGEQQRITQQQAGQQALEQLRTQGTETRLTAAQQIAASQELQRQKAALDIQVQAAAQTGDEASRSRLLAQQGEIDRQQTLLRGMQERDLTEQKGAIQRTLQSMDADQQRAAREQMAQIDRQLLDVKLQNDIAAQNLKGTQELNLQGLKGQQALDVAGIEAQYKQLMQTSDSVARIWTQSSAEIGAILRNPDTTPEVKEQQIARQVDLLRTGMDIAGTVANIDLSALLN